MCLYEYGTTENVKIVRDVLCDLHVVPKFNIAKQSIFPTKVLFFSGTSFSRVELPERIYARKELQPSVKRNSLLRSAIKIVPRPASFPDCDPRVLLLHNIPRGN